MIVRAYQDRRMTRSHAPILVVDDNRIDQKLLAVLLQGEGYAVRTAGSADEALAAIEADPPDLILADIVMPGTDGLELTRHLKANPATADIRIVAITAYPGTRDKHRAQSVGCDAYAAKPISTRTLPHLVADLLAKR